MADFTAFQAEAAFIVDRSCFLCPSRACPDRVFDLSEPGRTGCEQRSVGCLLRMWAWHCSECTSHLERAENCALGALLIVQPMGFCRTSDLFPDRQH